MGAGLSRSRLGRIAAEAHSCPLVTDRVRARRGPHGRGVGGPNAFVRTELAEVDTHLASSRTTIEVY